jgi:2-polyprenyl-6-methoxyphenol hydroxylase-like FAD-dependent oxidoreductase
MTRVLIIGAGLGGLTLAQGLRAAGVDVAVHERDRHRTDRLSGYRIHISPKGSEALHESLPAEVYQRFLDNTGLPSTGYSLFSEKLREVITLDSREIGLDPAHPVRSYKSVSRITFREALLTGLDDVVHFDQAFVRYESTSDGRVTAHFADGSSATGDVLVGADGVNSPVRGQYLPHLDRLDTGAFAISGKVPYTDSIALPEQFHLGAATIMAPHGYSGLAAVHRNRATAIDTGDRGLLLDTTRDYVMWNVVTSWANLAKREGLDRAKVEAMTGEALQELAGRVTARWHPNLRELISTADPDTVSLFAFRTSPRLDRWEPTNVTLLGDAVHSMPPTAGAGANTALYDANLLRKALLRGGPEAIGAYEDEMRPHAQRYVDTAMKNLERAVADNGFGLAMGKTALRVMNKVTPLRRKMAAATIS